MLDGQAVEHGGVLAAGSAFRDAGDARRSPAHWRGPVELSLGWLTGSFALPSTHSQSKGARSATDDDDT
jgi:hypothetical protein